MSTRTAIAWTDHTFNPWWGCVKIDPGCARCYAETFARQRLGLNIWGPNSTRRLFGDKHWAEPRKWNLLSCRAIAAKWGVYCAAEDVGLRGPGQPHLVFCGSMCDWAEDHPTCEQTRPRLWQLIHDTPNLTWQLLTKRADRIAQCLPPDWGDGWPNVWLGVSVSEPKGLWRIAELARVPARVRFMSYEPALADISPSLDVRALDWIIFGGESGPGYRTPEGWQDWARKLRDVCADAGVAYFFKQSPAARTEMGTTLDGQTIHQFPNMTPN
jgi:protein gp37